MIVLKLGSLPSKSSVDLRLKKQYENGTLNRFFDNMKTKIGNP
jgi:hypothetical protein